MMMKLIDDRLTQEMMTVKPMEAVAQMVVVPHYEYEKMVFTDGELPETTRGEGGFNSTQR